MERIAEPELMDDEEQARAYSEADFEEPHQEFINLLLARLKSAQVSGIALDLGCGPADITMRFAKTHSEMVVHGVDAAQKMLNLGQKRLARENLSQRVLLVQGYLPGAELPKPNYDIVFSNSLLHHLNDPNTLWETVRRTAQKNALVFVMDLRRPQNDFEARALVEKYAEHEPKVLKHDFFFSLKAAYRQNEIEAQLLVNNLDHLMVEEIGDRHVIIWGRMI